MKNVKDQEHIENVSKTDNRSPEFTDGPNRSPELIEWPKRLNLALGQNKSPEFIA